MPEPLHDSDRSTPQAGKHAATCAAPIVGQVSDSMRHEDTKQAMLHVLVDRILHGEGATSPDQRQRAFDNNDVAPPLHTVWTIAERELMAAFISTVNGSGFCVGAHTATAMLAYQDTAKVQAVLEDLESAPIDDKLRTTLRMLGTLTREGTVAAEDMRQVLAVGVSHQQVRDALAVCAAFNTTNRLADTFGFEQLSPAGFEAGAAYLIKRGYR
ncbi:carboxymuconolactone decarboxylase family protein [Nocardia rhizosphaerihabitans]|uniref:carboxymuconolactone decarboxylase family protein n=1 Tax=Nocardia rhizosphaerihabitans TaxID=1691570 RepID=UPI00366B5FF2